MNKTAIKNFAIWARNKLIADISYRAGLMGITAYGIQNALPQSTGTTEFYDIGTSEPYAIAGDAVKQRRHLVELIRGKEKETNYKTAYKYVLEEVAYTWFNRLIAVRFMEVNDYLPSHIRVLSSDSGKMEPDLVTTPFDAELSFTRDEEQLVYQLKQENKIDELFRILFIKQCNALNVILPALFEKTSDYTELLLNLSVIDQDGVVYHLVHDIPEEDFAVEQGGQVEIIGWFYQYYNDERKNEVININKSSIEKADIPAATQLFTTDWVVRYLVDNALGRYWIERNETSRLKEKLEFYIEVNNKESNSTEEIVRPEELKILDPCMGSGHFLVYAFDVLMLIYSECGYSERDAARSIIENNLYGLDIDDRASQLAYFAVMMKARKHNRRIFSGEVECHVYSIPESNNISFSALSEMGQGLKGDDRSKALAEIQELIEDFHNAKEIGSIMHLKKHNWDLLRLFVKPKREDGQMSLDFYDAYSASEQLLKIINVAEILTTKFPVITTNPPYLNKYSVGLKNYVSKYYKDYSGDLFSVFVYKCFDLCVQGGYTGFMTPYVWMFIQTYEKLRKYIIESKGIESLIQMEYSAFSEATVPICAFVLTNEKQKNGVYIRLSEFKGGMQVQKQKVLEALANKQCPYIYIANQDQFSAIPGAPIAYWMPEVLINSFLAKEEFGDSYECYVGMRTGDNARFLRLWQEVSSEQEVLTDASVKDTYNKKWVPYLKGGDFRRWYYNYDYVVDWLNNGEAIKENTRKVYPQLGENLSWKITNESQYFREGITFNAISSSAIGFKRFYRGAIFSNASHAIMHADSYKLNVALAFLNSKVVREILSITSPTINYTPSDIKKLPFKQIDYEDKVSNIAIENVEISQKDWDSFETSWNFKKHPLI